MVSLLGELLALDLVTEVAALVSEVIEVSALALGVGGVGLGSGAFSRVRQVADLDRDLDHDREGDRDCHHD
jgi:hypothetical protein